jgi:hypothetical protein
MMHIALLVAVLISVATERLSYGESERAVENADSIISRLILDLHDSPLPERPTRYRDVVEASDKLIFALFTFAEQMDDPISTSDERLVGCFYSAFLADQYILTKTFRHSLGKDQVLAVQSNRLRSVIDAYPISKFESADERLQFTIYLATAFPSVMHVGQSMLREKLTKVSRIMRLPIVVALAEVGDDKDALNELEGVYGDEGTRLRTIFRMYLMNSPYGKNQEIKGDSEQESKRQDR